MFSVDEMTDDLLRPQSKQFNRSIYLAAEGMRLMCPKYFTPEVRSSMTGRDSFFSISCARPHTI